MAKNKHPYAVRQQRSGYTGQVSYIVVLNPGGRRVSVHAMSREQAQASADGLNIGAMVKDYADDPRPYAERLAEAQALHAREQEIERLAAFVRTRKPAEGGGEES